MNFIKSAFTFLFALAILGSSGLADARTSLVQSTDTKMDQLLATDNITGVSILPSTTSHSSTPGYKIVDLPFKSQQFYFENTSWTINPSNFYPCVNSIKPYSLQIIYAFHSFW